MTTRVTKGGRRESAAFVSRLGARAFPSVILKKKRLLVVYVSSSVMRLTRLQFSRGYGAFDSINAIFFKTLQTFELQGVHHQFNLRNIRPHLTNSATYSVQADQVGNEIEVCDDVCKNALFRD